MAVIMVMSGFQHLYLFQRLVVSESLQFDLKGKKGTIRQDII